MIRLADILIESKIVQVPQEILDKLPEIYNYIKSNLEDIKKKSPTSYEKGAYIPEKLKNYLKFKDLSGKDISVSVGMYNDPEDAGSGRMDTINDIMLINLAFFGDKEDFLELGEHELVHAMDPKVRDQKLFGREFVKKGSEPTEKGMEKYMKSPWEFDAFTAPLINKLKRSKERLKNDGEFKNRINAILNALKTKTPEEVLNDEELINSAWYFSDKEWKEENWPYISSDFKKEMDKIKTWISKPTLYKRFLQRYSKIIS